jgi:hypothetical protein
MKVAIDISIFTSGGAFGNASGTLELEAAPQVGDTISFAFPKVAGMMPVPGFTGMLRVKDRVLNAADGVGVSLALEDIVVPTEEHAHAIAEYLEKGFGLGVDMY